jgi:hypothetical protein
MTPITLSPEISKEFSALLSKKRGIKALMQESASLHASMLNDIYIEEHDLWRKVAEEHKLDLEKGEFVSQIAPETGVYTVSLLDETNK